MGTLAVNAARGSQAVKTLAAMGWLLAGCARSVSADSGPSTDATYDSGDVSVAADTTGDGADVNVVCLDEPVLISGFPCTCGEQFNCRGTAQTLVDGGTVHESCVPDTRTGGWCIPADCPCGNPDADSCHCGNGPPCPMNQLCISDTPDSSARCVCLGR